jgi:hypothetical protein
MGSYRFNGTVHRAHVYPDEGLFQFILQLKGQTGQGRRSQRQGAIGRGPLLLVDKAQAEMFRQGIDDLDVVIGLVDEVIASRRLCSSFLSYDYFTPHGIVK